MCQHSNACKQRLEGCTLSALWSFVEHRSTVSPHQIEDQIGRTMVVSTMVVTELGCYSEWISIIVEGRRGEIVGSWGGEEVVR